MSAEPAAPDPAFNLEFYKANLQAWLEEIKKINAREIEVFRLVFTAGQNALRTSFFMNGGASVAILTFIGHLATNASCKAPIRLLAPSLGIPLAPTRMLVRPGLLEPPDGRGREPAGILAEQCDQRLLEITGGDALQVENRDQHL